MNVVSAPTIPGFTLKWSRNPGNSKTIIGPLAAELVASSPGLEIVVTGGSTLDDQTPSTCHGDITVLSASGATLWKATGYPIGIHQTFEIADLNKDGALEIVVTAWGTTLALYGNNGNLYWRAGAASDDLFPAIADINGDGYPEVFVCSGDAPSAGYDWITLLSYDGNILRQATSWHPCFGGVTVGDTNSDGRFELYQGDRSNRYGASDDIFRGGGKGFRAFDAHTLTPLWNDITPLCSSHAPMLADVDKDGILDVIVADQSSSGILVLNSADGTVVTTGGVYRKGGTQMSPHSQPTICDIDNDGNLELIDCSYGQPKAWDLFTWQSNGALQDELGNPLQCAEPPKAADVTGDGKLDLIAVGDSSPSNSYSNQVLALYIYSYDEVAKQFVIVHKQTLGHEPRAFSLVQDIDGDGLNELVLTSSEGTVYCFDTPASAPTPRVRTTNQFYSERKCGAAVYVPPPTPSKPVVIDEQPLDGALGQAFNPALSVQAVDFQGDSMDITFRTNASDSWQIIPPQHNGVSNGRYSVTPSNMNKAGTTYYWSVTATAGADTTSKTFKFTTYSNAPTQTKPLLTSADGMNGSKENLICYNQSTTDVDADKVTNIYSWYKNGVPLTNLLLPFDTRTSSNPLSTEELFSDGFEIGFSNWDGNGATDWDRTQTQEHSGSYSAHAGSDDTSLVSDNIDLSNAESITVSFWYRDHGIDDDDEVLLQFWNGSLWRNIFELGNSRPEDTWQLYTVQSFDPEFLITSFRLRFTASSIDAGEDLWIDDFSITSPIRVMDYSGSANHGTIHQATWTSQGKVGGGYNFDGLNDYMQISDDPTLGGDGTWSQITVELWIKPAATHSGAFVLAKKDPADSSASYRIRLQSGNRLAWGIRNSIDDTFYEITVPSADGLSVGNWHHVLCTYRLGQGLTIFINGTQRAKSATPVFGTIDRGAGSSIHGQPLLIGYDGGADASNPRTKWFNGIIDEVRIYPQALTQYQASRRYLDTNGGLSSSSTIAWQETNVGDIWSCQVTPNDSFRDGQSILSNTLTVVRTVSNNPPVASNAAITPSPPHTDDDLVLSYDYFDADGDPECNSEIRWYKNNVLQPTLNDWLAVPSSLTARGEVWRCTVRARDGADFGDPVSVSVTILNAAPSIAGAYITPDPSFDTGVLTANPVGWSDIDGDVEGYTYQWQRRVSGDWQNMAGATSKTLSSQNFNGGDYLRVGCTPYDGQDYGLTIYSRAQWIATFTLPLLNPLLISSLQMNTTDEALVCYNQTGSQKTNIYNWYKNDVSLTNLLMPFDTNSPTTAKDYSGYGNNGAVSGATWTSNGAVGGAYSFAGDDYMVVTDSSSLGNDGTWSEITLEYWVNPFIDQRGARIINKNTAGTDASGNYMTGFNTDAAGPANVVFFGVIPTGKSYTETYSETDTVVPTGSWSHIVATYKSGDGIKIYINGVLKSSNLGVTGTISSSVGEPLFIGYAGGGSANRYFNGLLDEVRIYPKALSPQQITRRYMEVAGKLVSSSTIVPEETEVGETWKCQVTPNTGTADGTARFSNTLTVISSGPPVQYNLLIETRGSGTTNPAPGTYPYGSGTVVPVDAQPFSGWVLDHWLRNGSNVGSADPYQITMDNNYNLTAVFKAQYQLTIQVQGTGTTNPAPGSYNYTDGTVVSVDAQPAAGWKLDYWLLDSVNVGNADPYAVTMSANHVLRAVFVQLQYELLIETRGSGTTDPAPGTHAYGYGTAVNVDAQPVSGWMLSHWLRNGSNVGSADPYQITMDNNYNLTAIFIEIPPVQYQLTIQVQGTGTTSPAPGSYMYNAGTVVSVDAQPAAGWKLDYWLLDSVNVGNADPYDVTMNTNHVLRAVFVLIPPVQYGLLIETRGSGTTDPAPGTHTYSSGTIASVDAQPIFGWKLDYWLRNGSNVGSADPYQITMDNNYNLTAMFVVDEGRLFEDGFETGSFSRWDGTSVTTGETATVVQTLPHDGAYHARFTTDGTASFARSYCYKNIAASSQLYTLAYVYIDTGLPLSNWNSLWLFQFRDASGNAIASFGVLGSSSGTRWACMYGGQYALASSGPQLDTWYAVEVYFNKSSSGKTLVIYVDSLEVASLTVNTSASNNVGQVRVGITYNDPSYTFNLYIDTVTIDDQYIPIGPTYSLSLDSAEDGGASSNLGTVTIAGTPYSLPQNIVKGAGVYTCEYSPAPGYTFDHWVTSGLVSVSNAYSASTSLTISGDGTLDVIYTKVQGAPLFESGFETGSFSEWDGTSVTTGETATVVQTLPHDGVSHAQFTTDGAASSARSYCYKNIAPTGELYTKMYVYIDSGLPLTSWNALWLIQFRDASGSAIASYGVKADASGAKWACMYGSQNAFAASGPQLDTWYAVEAYFVKAASGKTLVIYVDGLEVASLSVDTSGSNNVTQVRVGIAYSDPSYTFNLYIDTVTIDDQYI